MRIGKEEGREVGSGLKKERIAHCAALYLASFTFYTSSIDHNATLHSSLSLSLSLSLSFLNSSHIFVYYFFPIFKQKVAVVVAIVIAIGSGIASAGHQPGINRRDPADDGPKRSEMPMARAEGRTGGSDGSGWSAPALTC